MATVSNSSTVPLLVPVLPRTERLVSYLQRIDSARWYSNFGPLSGELEKRLARSFREDGADDCYVVTVSNATAGIELSLRALNLPSGSLVLVPAFTFIATAAAVLSAGLTPMCCDVDPLTWQMTPEIAKRALQDADVRAIVPVCVFGREQSGKAWTSFEAEFGIPVVIDAAAAFANQRDAGATCAIFSMHATKPLSSGEGGFIVTRSEQFAEDVRQLSNFGINLTRPAVSPIGTSTTIGINAKLSEYHAAVGLASLDEWPENARARRELFAAYQVGLSDAIGGQATWQVSDADTVRSVVAILLPKRETRDKVEAALRDANVMSRRWYCPTVDKHPTVARLRHLPTPIAHRIGELILGVPFHLALSDVDRQRIYAVLKDQFRASVAA